MHLLFSYILKLFQHYLNAVHKYITNLKQSNRSIQSREELPNYNSDAKSHRKRKRLKRESEIDIIEQDQHSAYCKEGYRCTCLQRLENDLLDENESDDEPELASQIGHRVEVEAMTWTDNDSIDFRQIQSNWAPDRGQNRGIRSICKPVTVAICDRWFKRINTPLQTNEGSLSNPPDS